MQILRTLQDLKTFLVSQSGQPGCFADTTFLYALAYDDDRLYPTAIETSEILAEFQIPNYANVISRMEFVDLIFRKQITLGAAEVFKSLQQNLLITGDADLERCFADNLELTQDRAVLFLN